MPNGRTGAFVLKVSEFQHLLSRFQSDTEVGKTFERPVSSSELTKLLEQRKRELQFAVPLNESIVVEEHGASYVVRLKEWITIDEGAPLFFDLRVCHLKFTAAHTNLESLRKAREARLVEATQSAPRTAESFYKLGLLNWFIVANKEAATLSEQESLIDEGLRNLDAAIALDPTDSDTLLAKSLLLDESARLADTSLQKSKLADEAEVWLRRARDAYKVAR